MRNRAGVRDHHANSGHRRDPMSIVVAETKLKDIVYTWSAVCTVQLINTWCQASLVICLIDYSENGERTEQTEDRQTHRGVRPRLKITDCKMTLK